MLAVFLPVVTVARRVLAIPVFAEHCIDVSEYQLVSSHAVCPNRTCGEYPTVPRLRPKIVVLKLPEDGTFDLATAEIILSSYENACVVTATSPVAPIVNEACSVLPILVVILQDTEDSEIQVVPSHPVCPRLLR
jgi:hypothetical protein